MSSRQDKIVIVLIIGFTASLIWACGSSRPVEISNVESVFKEAVALFEDEDYMEAEKYFDLIKLQYPASQYADDAQFYQSEINFERGEYILAAFNFNKLRSTYPNSEYVKIALYKAALCYYEISPPYDRDQEYTRKAIDALNLYQRYYSGDSLYTKAGEMIDELRNKLAHREYFTAELYNTIDLPKSALIYYDTVINDFSDTKYYEQSYIGKIETLIRLGRKDEALGLIELYKKKFPSGSETDLVNSLKKSLQE